MYLNLGAKVAKNIEIIRSILQKKGCNPRKDGLQPFIPYYIYDRAMITLSYIHLWKLITAEPTLQPYLLQRSSRPCSYRQPEHSEADRHRRPESTWQLRESSYQRSNHDPLPYHR